MSFVFGNASKIRLAECDERLKLVAELALASSPIDFGVTCGHRGKDEQDRCVAQGLSKTPWPTSKHNASPSRAFDFVPFVDGKPSWDKPELFRQIAHHLMDVARQNEIKLRWGGDFNRDGNEANDKFVDLPHVELDEV